MESTNQVAPPLDVDLNTIDTTLPLLEGGGKIYELVCAMVTPGLTKAGAPILKLQLNTTEPSRSQDGRDLGPGIPVFENLNLAPSGKATWDMVARNIGAVVQGFGVQVQGTNFPEQLAYLTNNSQAILQGQICRCKVGIEPAGIDKNGKSFKAKNVIEVWLPKGK
ncbi:MAG: hypothetical protein KGL39_08480 [Patescibacteria group bacterium]|nr:hypothetical protein [Patescibacteria group bacterium]